LREAFEKIGYTVEERQNRTADQIISDLTIITRKINTKILKPNPFVAIFLTHGHESVISGTDDECLEIRKIMNLFSDNNCKPLKDILKLIIIGSCRGSKYLSKNNSFLEF
jgi:mRNA degradation ribonuclease J1/J2